MIREKNSSNHGYVICIKEKRMYFFHSIRFFLTCFQVQNNSKFRQKYHCASLACAGLSIVVRCSFHKNQTSTHPPTQPPPPPAQPELLLCMMVAKLLAKMLRSAKSSWLMLYCSGSSSSFQSVVCQGIQQLKTVAFATDNTSAQPTNVYESVVCSHYYYTTSDISYINFCQ